MIVSKAASAAEAEHGKLVARTMSAVLPLLGGKFFPKGSLGGISHCPPHATFELLGSTSPYVFRKQLLQESHRPLLKRGNW